MTTVNVSTEQYLFLCYLLFIDTVLEGSERGPEVPKPAKRRFTRMNKNSPSCATSNEPIFVYSSFKHHEDIITSYWRNTFFGILISGKKRVGNLNKNPHTLALWNLFSPATVFCGTKQSRIKKLVQINTKTCGEMNALSLLHSRARHK